MKHKKLILILLVFFTLTGCAQHKKVPQKKTYKKAKTEKTNIKQKKEVKNKDTDTAILITKADSICAFSKKYLGVKYKYGGEDPSGFDCAGFVCFVYKKYGVKLPRSADAQALLGKEIERKALRPADLVYFKGRDVKNKAIGHVGIVLSNQNGEITFISATVSSGIHIDSIDGPYWKERFVIAKRILIGQ